MATHDFEGRERIEESHEEFDSLRAQQRVPAFRLFQKRSRREGTQKAQRNSCSVFFALFRGQNISKSKPPQTGTRLLTGYGEVATTSGSTNSLPRGVTSACRVLTPTVLVRTQARQPTSMRNGECGMRNRCSEHTSLSFRIPHSELRISIARW